MPTVESALTLAASTGSRAVIKGSGGDGGGGSSACVLLRPQRLEEADEDADADANAETDAEAVEEAEANAEADAELCVLPDQFRVNYVCQVTKDARDAMARYDCSGREVLMFCAILFLGGVAVGLTIGLVQSSSKLESGHQLLHACKDLKAEYRRMLDVYDKNVSTETTRRLEEQLASDKDYVLLRVAEGAGHEKSDDSAAASSSSADIDPCVDLHRHACARWPAANPAPDFRRLDGRSGAAIDWSVYDVAEYRWKLAAHGRLLDAGDVTYLSCLRWRAGDPGVTERLPWERLHSLTRATELGLEALFRLVHLRLRLDSFLTVYAAPALVDSARQGLFFDIRVRQPLLPRRTVLAVCRAFRVCRLPNCAEELLAIDRVERAYSDHLSGNKSQQFSDPLDARAQPITEAHLQEHLPQFRWDAVLSDDDRRLHLYADWTFIKILGELLRPLGREELRTFLLWSLARSLYPLVSKATFSEISTRQKALPAWIWCLDSMPPAPLAKRLAASELGRQLNGRKRQVQLLGRKVRDQWVKQLIKTGILIDSRILDKIQLIKISDDVGYEPSADSQANTSFSAGAGSSFFVTVLRLLLEAGDVSPEASSQLSVNAFYNRQRNSIQMSMANFQAPFFSPDGPDFVNFAGLGSVFGHEIFHSIDSVGHRFNAVGSRLGLLGQRPLQVGQPLMRLCAEHLIGCDPQQLTELSDESLADQFGLVMALAAFLETVQHLPAPEIQHLTRQFFLAYATSNCAYEMDPASAESGTYPTWKDRVNKPVQQLRQFHQAFNCTALAA